MYKIIERKLFKPVKGNCLEEEEEKCSFSEINIYFIKGTLTKPSISPLFQGVPKVHHNYFKWALAQSQRQLLSSLVEK